MDSYDQIFTKVTSKDVQGRTAATRAKNKVVYFVADAGILSDLAGRQGRKDKEGRRRSGRERGELQMLGQDIWNLATRSKKGQQWGALAHNVVSMAVKEFSEKKRKLNNSEVTQIYRNVVVRGNNNPKIGPLKNNLKEKALNNKDEKRIINVFMNVMAEYGLAEPSAKQLQEFLKRSIAKQYKVMLQEKRLMSNIV